MDALSMFDGDKSPAESADKSAHSKECGCGASRVRKCPAHLADIEDFDRYNAFYREFFQGVAALPARTTVQSVLWNQIMVEIDCVARKAT